MSDTIRVPAHVPPTPGKGVPRTALVRAHWQEEQRRREAERAAMTEAERENAQRWAVRTCSGPLGVGVGVQTPKRPAGRRKGAKLLPPRQTLTAALGESLCAELHLHAALSSLVRLDLDQLTPDHRREVDNLESQVRRNLDVTTAQVRRCGQLMGLVGR